VDVGSRNVVPLDPGIEDGVAADLGIGIERSDPVGRNVHARGEVRTLSSRKLILKDILALMTKRLMLAANPGGGWDKSIEVDC
jgi:hypothetical protein